MILLDDLPTLIDDDETDSLESAITGVRVKSFREGYEDGLLAGYQKAIKELHLPSSEMLLVDWQGVAANVKAKDALGHGSEKRGGMTSGQGKSADMGEPWDVDCFTSGGEEGGECKAYPELAHLFGKYEERIKTAGGLKNVMHNVIKDAPGKLYQQIKRDLIHYASGEGTDKIRRQVQKDHPEAEVWWEPPSEGATFGTTWAKYDGNVVAVKAFEESKHPRANDGKFGHGSSSHITSTIEKADSWAKRVIDQVLNIPHHVMIAAREKVKKVYGRLVNRYGKGYARVAVAAGCVGLAIPFPGASAILAAPIVAVAELHRQLSDIRQEVHQDGTDAKVVKTASGWFKRQIMKMATAPAEAKSFPLGELLDAVEIKATFEESKHPRDHGKFSSSSGSQGTQTDDNDEDQSSVDTVIEHKAMPEEAKLAKAQAKKKVKAAPVPPRTAVFKARRDLREAKRAGGDSRGGSAKARRAQRVNLFNEFEAKDEHGHGKGYAVCACGTKLHHDRNNKEGYEALERGKIFTKRQGGGYQLSNLLPECFSCNRSRNDTPIRSENLK